MTHVLHLSTWHPVIDDVSGVFVLEQCAALASIGVQVGLIFSRLEGLRSLTLRRALRGMPGMVRRMDPVPTLGFKSWNLPGSRRLLPRFSVWMLQDRYARYEKLFGRPDILHAHVGLESGPAARKIAARIGREYVVTEHSSEILHGSLDPSREQTVRQVYADARCVIAVSSALARRVIEICPTAKVKVAGNLVRDTVFQLRRPPSARGDRISLVSIGGLYPNKRVAIVFAAFAKLPPALTDRIDYHVIGEGPERQQLERLAQSAGMKTIFHGNLPHQEAMALLSRADALVHASAYETFGLVMAEAMALGLPVVATRSGGPEEFVTDQVGTLVPVDDVDALAMAIEDMAGQADIWRGRRDMIAAQAFERFHETSVGRAIAEAYS